MSAEPPAKRQSRTWDPYSIVPIYHPRLAVDVATDFCFGAHAEGTTSPWEMQKQRRKASEWPIQQRTRQRPQWIMRNFRTVSTQNPNALEKKNRLKYLVL